MTAMKFVPMDQTEYPLFHQLLNDYYRDGEDAETAQNEIDGFIGYLYDLCTEGKIAGAVAWDDAAVGFVVWTVDTPDGVFSQRPGCGTILEIGVQEAYQGRGAGRKLVDHALGRMKNMDYYVCAYGPAESFWKKCGFRDSGEIAENGLRIYLRDRAPFQG